MQGTISNVTAHKLTQAGSGLAVGVMVGISVGLTGIFMQISKNGREKKEHEARMKKLLSDD
jgi:hypothetical protein